MTRFWYLTIPIFLSSIVISVPNAYSTEGETFLVEIIASDGLTAEPLSGVILEIISVSGTIVAKDVTDDLGRAEFNLPSGDYTLGSSITIYGFELNLQSTSIEIERPTNIDLTLTAVLIPVRFLPLAINVGALSITSYSAYRIMKRIRRVPPLLLDSFRNFNELEELRTRIAETHPAGERNALITTYSQLTSRIGERYNDVGSMYEHTQKYLHRIYKAS